MKASSIFAGCLPRILRRILCFSTQLSPSYYLKEEDNEEEEEKLIGVSPGIVAKLMGLESLPQSRRHHGTIIPITYQEAEDENFYIFNFESHFKKKRRRKKKKNKKDTNNHNHNTGKENNVVSQRNFRMRVNSKTEVDSENSSPNSVLEFLECSADRHQQASCSGDVTRMGNSRMRRTLCEELDKCEASGEEKRLLIVGFGEQSVDEGNWDEIRMEVTRLRWVQDEILRNNQNCDREIGIDIASLILDQLLDELLSSFNHF